ncbi:MAG: hypothetical protein ACR2O6_04510, partial [Ilumatobacteraceae bacterium]
LFPVDQAGFDELAPLLWSPFLPGYDDIVGGLADALVAESWFDGVTLGVVGIDSGMNQRAYEEKLLPRLDDAGVEVASLQWVDPTDTSTLETTQAQAILEFKDAGVTHLIVLGGSRLAAFLIDIGSTQNFTTTFAVTSYDSPEFSIRNWPDLMEGSVGISVLPGWDIADDQYPFPASDAESECLDIFFSGGVLFNSRANARTGLLYCDAVRLLVAAGERADQIDPASVSAAMWELGDEFESASVYSVEFIEGKFSGGAGYRVFAFDPACTCMTLRGDTVAFAD